MSNLALHTPQDPASLSYQPTLPVEVALRTASIRNICISYKLNEEEWNTLRHDPLFIRDVQEAATMLKKEGMSFKMKAKLQSESLLQTSWQMIHAKGDEVPPSVKADLLKFTIRAAGLDGSLDKSQQNIAPTLQIQINL